MLASRQLLTLTGAGGCGKTRLALQAAAEVTPDYEDGTCLVELAALADPGGVAHAVATALGLREVPDRPLADAVVGFLRDKRLLLVVDNCEHVVDAVARLIDTVLRTCPRVRILATSREPLGCVGEMIWRVPSLIESEAVSLFTEGAHAARPEVTIGPADQTAIVEICRQLDGIPLAIELAAARVPVFSIQQIAIRLDDCFRLLSAGPRTALPRHQTQLAAVEWSYALLSEPERAVLRRLSMFAGGWTFDAAEEVVAGNDVQRYAVLDLLAQLVNNSGTAEMLNFFRKPFGPGWALVGDAGYHKDSITAQVISDAFRDAELVAEAVDAGVSCTRHIEEAMADYEQRRNVSAMPLYDLTCQFAMLEPSPP